MQGIDRWKLADELNVYQIALLIAGYDPSHLEQDYSKWQLEVKQATEPFISAIKNAARSDRFTFKRVNETDWDGIDWHQSTIDIETFVDWLRSRNFNDGFFIASASEIGAISDPDGPFYAVKLAAAVRAWTEVTSDTSALNGKSPKKALEIWLRKHANEYGLTGKDGSPNQLGIEEISKVSNWKPTGGASPTPTFLNPPTPTLREGRKVPSSSPREAVPQTGSRRRDMDDDIPF